MKLPMFVGTVALLTAVPLTVLAQEGVDPRPPNGVTQKPALAGQTDAPEQKSNVAFDVVTVVEGLQNPWWWRSCPAAGCWSPNGRAGCAF